MDCFRSGLEDVAELFGFEAVLDERAGAVGAPPKKSNPRRESAGFGFCCGGGGARWVVGSVVFGLAGGDTMSPKRSMFGCCGCARRTGPGTALFGAEATRCELDRSICAFCFTILSGCQRNQERR